MKPPKGTKWKDKPKVSLYCERLRSNLEIANRNFACLFITRTLRRSKMAKKRGTSLMDVPLYFL